MAAIVKEAYSDGIIKEIRHFRDLTKEEYGKILHQRVNMFVVWNKRIMNPIDKHDKDSHFIMVWERDRLLGCTRVCLPFSQGFETDDFTFNYPTWDKCTIVDMRVSMFPTDQSHAVCHMWAPEWGLRICGTENGQMDMYADGHPILLAYAKKEKNLKYIGNYKDKWGYEGYRWIYEPNDREAEHYKLHEWLNAYHET